MNLLKNHWTELPERIGCAIKGNGRRSSTKYSPNLKLIDSSFKLVSRCDSWKRDSRISVRTKIIF